MLRLMVRWRWLEKRWRSEKDGEGCESLPGMFDLQQKIWSHLMIFGINHLCRPPGARDAVAHVQQIKYKNDTLWCS